MPEQSPASQEKNVAAELTDVLTALSWKALQFTPKVAQLQGAVVLEASASERLWGGRQQLLLQILQATQPLAALKHAQGATALLALAHLQTGTADTLPDKLPLMTLAAALPHLVTLQRIGCTCWGQLRALPRGAVARRFGASLLDELDRAYGEKPEIYPWLELPEFYAATLELATQVETATAMLFGARRLFNQFQWWLQARHLGVLALEINWKMDARRNTNTEGKLLLRTAEPTADVGHLQRLLAEQLAHITLPAPVQYLGMRSLETQALTGKTASLLPDEKQTGDSLHQLLERLGARLGTQQVLQMRTCADHRPEQMQEWHSVADAKQWLGTGSRVPGRGVKPKCTNEALYPSWLLGFPVKLKKHQNRPWYLGHLTLLAGPQRIETGWWDGGNRALRDYFLARGEQTGLLWIYRERLAGRHCESQADWYLHGFFA
jgi:protein ImuB